MDPYQQQHVAGLIASMGIFFMLFGLAIAAFFVFLFWRIFTKAGMAGPLALIVLFPALGPLVAVCILAFADWKVAPVAPGYTGVPAYPPTPAYPPAPSSVYPAPSSTNYPPSGPPSQL